MPAIEVNGLTKKFGDFTAVDGISFAVEQGELFGLLGPNGAGKTTTINILSTLLRPTSGTAAVAGCLVTEDRDAVRHRIGIVFQETALDTQLTGKENLEFHAMMYRMPKAERRAKISEILKLVDLEEKADILVKTYSGGMKRRLEIGRGLVHRPQVLFLDEPTLGLDAQTRRHIWDYIRNLKQQKEISIILTTHYLEEADFLCDRVAILDHGKIVALNTPARLKDALGGDAVVLELDRTPDGPPAGAAERAWITQCTVQGNRLHFTVEQGERRIPELLGLAQSAGHTVQSVSLRKPSLEDVFLHYTGRSIREADEEAGPVKGRRWSSR
jgi:ABC-2 type transport system ATP-binding protein